MKKNKPGKHFLGSISGSYYFIFGKDAVLTSQHRDPYKETEGTLVIQIRGKRDRLKLKCAQLFSSKPATAYNLVGKGKERADNFFLLLRCGQSSSF